MNIAGWKDYSLVDVLGYPSFTVWFSFCNFKCPWCQNWPVVSGVENKEVSVGELIEIIEESAILVDFLHVTGGEPTLQSSALKALYACVREKDILKNSLNTNGSHPEVIRELATKGLLDHIAIDVKAPLYNPSLYARVIGFEVAGDVPDKVRESIIISLEKIDFVELRTTFVPSLLSIDDLVQIAQELKDLGCGDYCYYVIQQFNPSDTIRDATYRQAKRVLERDLITIAKKVKKQSTLKNVYIRTLEGGTKVIE